MRYFSWDDRGAAADFHAIIDTRSPAEFAIDHIPGAVNLPVLSDSERAEVGRLYCQVSRFTARRGGGAMVARNVAGHLDTFFSTRPEHERFLLYCWRGGQRSRSMALILDAVGWNVRVLSGGYKSWRAHVRESLAARCQQLDLRLLTGLTGSGKSRLLRELMSQGRQVLDLELLGRHRGSALGDEPDTPQPSQKHFESLIHQQLAAFDLTKPVWIEGESKRLGKLWITEPLWQAMLRATVHLIEVSPAARAAFLLEEYRHFTERPESLLTKLDPLKPAVGKKRLAQWRAMTDAGEWLAFVESLLENHYDPSYSGCENFKSPVSVHRMTEVTAAAVEKVARELAPVSN